MTEREGGPVHSTYVAAAPETVAAVVSAYRCGHCTGAVVELVTDGPMVSARVEHDDGCPVLAGAVPVVPDLLRAVVPATFRP